MLVAAFIRAQPVHRALGLAAIALLGCGAFFFLAESGALVSWGLPLFKPWQVGVCCVPTFLRGKPAIIVYCCVQGFPLDYQPGTSLDSIHERVLSTRYHKHLQGKQLDPLMSVLS